MQSIIALVVFAVAAVALPQRDAQTNTCKPATYTCATNPSTHVPGWEVCDTTGHWVVSFVTPEESKSVADKVITVRWRLPAQHAVPLPCFEWQPLLHSQLDTHQRKEGVGDIMATWRTSDGI